MNRNLSILRGPLSIAVLAFAVSACGSAAPSDAPTPSTAPTPSAQSSEHPSPSTSQRSSPSPSAPIASPSSSEPGDAEALSASEWSLIRLEGIDIPPTAGITVTFGPGGDLGGSGGCNQYGSRYSVEGDTMAIEDDIVSTMMGCEGVVGQRESAFFAALGAVETWRVADGRLTLSSAAGTELLVFEAVGQ